MVFLNRTVTEIEAVKLKEKIVFSLIKNNDRVIGFELRGLSGNEDCISDFFLGLNQMVFFERIKMIVTPSLKNLVVYDPQFMGQSIMKFPIKSRREASELKRIMEKGQYTFSVYKTKDEKFFVCRMAA